MNVVVGQRSISASGVTLVELLVGGVIATVLVSGVFTTFSFIGTTTQELTILEQLRSEAVYVDEYVSRWVALGTYAKSTGLLTERAGGGVFASADITIYGIDAVGDPIPLKRFEAKQNALFEDGNANAIAMPLGARLSQGTGAPLPPFRITDDGRRCSVDFTYDLSTGANGRLYFYPLSTITAVCKNQSTF